MQYFLNALLGKLGKNVKDKLTPAGEWASHEDDKHKC